MKKKELLERIEKLECRVAYLECLQIDIASLKAAAAKHKAEPHAPVYTITIGGGDS